MRKYPNCLFQTHSDDLPPPGSWYVTKTKFRNVYPQRSVSRLFYYDEGDEDCLALEEGGFLGSGGTHRVRSLKHKTVENVIAVYSVIQEPTEYDILMAKRFVYIANKVYPNPGGKPWFQLFLSNPNCGEKSELRITGPIFKGATFEQIIQQDPEAVSANFVDIIKNLAISLQKMHQAGCVHGDLKADNFFVHYDEESNETLVALADFSLSGFTKERIPFFPTKEAEKAFHSAPECFGDASRDVYDELPHTAGTFEPQTLEQWDSGDATPERLALSHSMTGTFAAKENQDIFSLGKLFAYAAENLQANTEAKKKIPTETLLKQTIFWEWYQKAISQNPEERPSLQALIDLCTRYQARFEYFMEIKERLLQLKKIRLLRYLEEKTMDNRAPEPNPWIHFFIEAFSRYLDPNDLGFGCKDALPDTFTELVEQFFSDKIHSNIPFPKSESDPSVNSWLDLAEIVFSDPDLKPYFALQAFFSDATTLASSAAQASSSSSSCRL